MLEIFEPTGFSVPMSENLRPPTSARSTLARGSERSARKDRRELSKTRFVRMCGCICQRRHGSPRSSWGGPCNCFQVVFARESNNGSRGRGSISNGSPDELKWNLRLSVGWRGGPAGSSWLPARWCRSGLDYAGLDNAVFRATKFVSGWRKKVTPGVFGELGSRSRRYTARTNPAVRSPDFARD